MELEYSELSVPGRGRQTNEDSIGVWMPVEAGDGCCRGAIAVLADGVGSLGQGDVASRIAVEACLRVFREARVGGSARQLVSEASRQANWEVYAAGIRTINSQRMGATLAVAAFCHDELIVANVGDSRIYHVRGAVVRQLSVDHTLVGVQQRFGLLTAEEARHSADRHLITRSLGQDAEVQFDIATALVAEGDLVVLCSDGLHGVLNDRELGEIVTHAGPLDACRRLVALAQHRGSEDDISVQVLRVAKLDQSLTAVPRPGAPATAPVVTPEMQPGQTLDNRFLLTEVVARSGMAIVFKAVDLSDNSTVAIKAPLPGHSGRLLCEVEVLRQLTHPNIVRFVAASAHPQREYLATGFLRGYTLSHLMRNICPLPDDEVRKTIKALCDGLALVHERGYVHRDIKPENIILCPDGAVCLMDFGLAIRAETHASFFRRFAPTIGSADYMAPEQVQGKAWDARTDIYAVGALMYEMVTGVAPFAGTTPKEVMQARLQHDPVPPTRRNPNVSAGMEKIIQRALARDPSARYQSAAEIKAALEALRR